MKDPLECPDEKQPAGSHPEEARDPGEVQSVEKAAGPAPEIVAEIVPQIVSAAAPSWTARQSANPGEAEGSRRRGVRHNLLLLASFTLAAFTLTAWILVRVDSPFGILTGPQEVVRAQLQALDRGELRPAYDMFSARYRQQVSYDIWQELIATHWRMFHAEVLRAGEPAQTGAQVTLEMVLRGADQKAYRARFTLIRLNGRWWIDDVHWAEEPDQRSTFRI
jgi:hypothetical protein